MRLSSAIYRHVLEKKLKNRMERFTENGVARELCISPNSVSIAIKRLEEIGAASIYRRHFEIIGFDKALSYWAATRKLGSDIMYSTYSDAGTSYIESSMPSGVAYTAYTGYSNLFGNDASDYSEVYVYATEQGARETARRFPKRQFSKGSDYANIIVLRPDRPLGAMIDNGSLDKSTVPITQLYVDLWNIKTWYAYEFVTKLKKRVDDAYAKAILQ